MEVELLREKLIKQYAYRTEMHAHTFPASLCSEVSPEQLVQTYSDLGYDTIVITNHFIYNYNFIKKYGKNKGIKMYYDEYETTKRFGQKYGINVILGAEIRFTENDNDYLIYGLTKEMLREIYDYLPFGVANFRKKYKMPDSIFIQAHPFRDNMKIISPELLDGIETFNLHQGHNSRVAITVRYASKNNILITSAGSDFHHIGKQHEGAAALRSKSKITDSFELADLLKSRDYIFEIGGQAIVLP